ncbi:hypothetical protein OMO38_00280 [Chryseobacterium sp. 09-1422]|uniref:Uncharacterized protein n=1 Tax=Chryseobacterium kimseyorum TaxID=2984028 RepID=A0ABT3HT31_9FLAO|nr:hypothetical protein [Chryseobacterium kimseyorum]MCW3166950.1 hypothetical protein [Chryseobacterium kimseyorum]
MKIYFHNYMTREGVPSDDPQYADLLQALEIFSGLNDSTENFFGIIDPSAKIIQFVLEAENQWLVEIPNLPSHVNDQQYANFAECIEIITSTFDENRVKIFPKMIKVDIMNESLQDLL